MKIGGGDGSSPMAMVIEAIAISLAGISMTKMAVSLQQ